MAMSCLTCTAGTRITLSNGTFAIVDDADAELLTGYRWHASGNGYAIATRTSGSRKKVFMHRLILDARPGQEVDHINGDGLDNRRRNLRFVTRQQNSFNSRQRGGTSRFKGVWRSSRGNGWTAGIMVNGKGFNLGVFASELQAAYAYNIAAVKAAGPYARLNDLGGGS